MSGKVAKKAPRKRGANAYKLPDPIPAGQILTDLMKKQWILGKSIGVGGFGEIYCAAPYSGKTVKDYPYVVKIEPHGNGPLFVEMHFYMRNAKPDEINSWKKDKKISLLGMPPYIGSGSHEYNNTKYRFVVMQRYGTDLWKLFEENNKRFPEHTVYKIALQVVNVLEYMHSKTYVHADIKGANLLLDLKSHDQVFLVDFGLASHYTTKAEYKFDPKKAHNGTIEYTSRDAHMGVPTMRGDFEILGYNMIQWLSGSLPWEKDLSNPSSVQKQKEAAFENIPNFLDKCFNGSVPDPVRKYMTLLGTLKFNQTPDYNKFREILVQGLKSQGHKPDGTLEFKNSSINAAQRTTPKPTPQKQRKITEKTRKSPRVKKIKEAAIAKSSSLDDSNVGILLDKKRGGANDIRQILNSIDSDEEYDIKITKKKKKKVEVEKTKESPERVIPKTNRGATKAKRHYVSESDSEPEVISKGTRTRPTSNSKPNARSNTRTKIVESASDDDMFED